ncbi:GntR family transcriptional regulator [Streptomyces tropicalis]|uniref:GntR family transcriptional regulator n=1 Tax=Streptomyces tropicalis TaxID=3034234 RepID=A0ABT6ACL9_9ACTN|nr:GntR family transcriptional regulator [Streptomyces tropicalis]MDF3302393.1 GntR family transcriptional regulator [Streptomyces tropicalis]
MTARHEEIAEALRRAIDREEYTVGSRLPPETELAAHYGVSRGTVRQAVAALTAEGLIGSRQGARRVVLAGRRSQSFAELRSFAQWARAMGREATGRVVAQEFRPATEEDALRLHLRERTPVLHVLRVRGLDGEPVLLERTVYADWIAPAVAPIEPGCPSVTQRLHESTGLVFAYGEHVIDAVAAGARDAHLLGVRRTSPLLRVRRVTTTREGRPVEWSDDRYRSDAVSFTVHNSIGNNALARTTADG